MDKSILNEKRTVLSTDYTPQYEQLYIHPEEGEDFRINSSLAKINSDMMFVDNFLISKAKDLNSLMIALSQRLDNIDLDVKSEQGRLQDIKMLCNKYTDFDKVIPITSDTNLGGEYTINNNTFYAAIDKQTTAKLKVLDVAGNGIEGNKYVYKDYAYVQDSVDTSNRSFMIDNSLSSCYEYERITASASEEYLLNDFNTDNAEAKCTVTFYSEKAVNLITVTSDDDELNVIGIQYSTDGVEYYPLAIPTIKINNKLESYNNYEYICGDNKVFVPEANYIKISFQSSGTTDDVLAYDRIMFWHKEEMSQEDKDKADAADGIIGGDLAFPETNVADPYNNLIDETIAVETAKRHAIRINDVSAVSNIYKTSSYFKTGELISDCKFYAVALFANVYMPEVLSSDNVEFTFTINGIDYKAYPINYSGPGNKVFRYSQGKSSPDYTVLVDEPIKSLSLTVKLSGTTEFTPFIANLKVLLGGDI